MRRLAGTFDPHGRAGRAGRARLAGALAPDRASILEHGPLRVACTGAPPGTAGPEGLAGPLCLLEGFLDNAEELGAALRVAARSPEELLLAGWRRWGRELLPRLRGDFALLLWDPGAGHGLLARDQLGVRSLFVHDAGGVLCFAGELRDLLALLPSRPAPDPVGVAHWVAGSGRPGPGTLYGGVRRVEPGSVLSFGPRGIEEYRYWSPRFREPEPISGSEIAGEVRDAISVAVGRRLSPGGATGVLMSGGLDSSAVAAEAGALAPGSVSAYCGEFPEHAGVDESERIALLRHSLGLGGVTAEVGRGGLLASALESQRAWDAPLLDWGAFWTLPLLREAASAGVQVILGGDGGDELFGVRAYLLADEVRAGHLLRALGLMRRLPGAAYRPPLAELAGMAATLGLSGALPHGAHELLRRPLAARRAPAWVTPQAARALAGSEDPLAWKRLDGPRWWAHAAHALTRGVEELGVFESLRRTAALAGLEARHPLFDLDLVELVLRAPPRSTFDARIDRPVLRASMAGLLPDEIRMRRGKALFDPLIIDSLLGADGAAVRALLSDPRAELRAHVDLDAARGALLDGGERSPLHPFVAAQYVWRLVTAECWLRAQSRPADEVLPPGVRTTRARVNFRPAPPAVPSSDGTFLVLDRVGA